MTTQTQTTLLDQLKPLAAELADVQSKIADLGERESALKAQIRDLIVEPGTYDADGLTVAVQSNRRFDPDAFKTSYPVTTHPQFYKLVPDTTAVRRGLSPDDYATFMAEVGDFKVGLK